MKKSTDYIYCYHKEIENQLLYEKYQIGKYKIGYTSKRPEKRVKAQDGTSDSEPLVLDWYEELNSNYSHKIYGRNTDKEFHNWLVLQGIYKCRTDANREWFFIKDQDIAHNLLIQYLTGTNATHDYNMRPCQQNACSKITKFFDTGGLEFLLAAKMRFGKNFTILNAIKKLGYKNILVLTYKPSVFASLEIDVKSHILFVNDFVYQNYENCVNKDKTQINLIDDKVNIITCSAQQAGYNYDDNTGEIKQSCSDKIKKNLNALSSVEWDLIITDECHYGTQTENFIHIRETINCSRILYISGTPYKIIDHFSDEAIFKYDYLDEYNDKISGEQSVQNMATMIQYAITLDNERIKDIQNKLEIADRPTLTKIFHATDGKFKNNVVATEFISNIISTDIAKYCTNSDGKHILVVLPGVDACQAAAEYINTNYSDTYVGINCGGSPKANNAIIDIQEVRQIIYNQTCLHKGTICFTCGRFIEGSSVPEWDIVIMLYDGKSPEAYTQTMFRGQTPKKGKNEFYVLDYNPERMLSQNYDMIHSIRIKNKHNDPNLSSPNKYLKWLDATPIYVVNTNNSESYRLQGIDGYNKIVSTYLDNDGVGYSRMEDNSIVKRIHEISIHKDDIVSIVNSIKPDSTINKDVKLNNNGIEGGKNKAPETNKTNLEPNEPDPKSKYEKTDKNKYSISALQKAAKEIAKTIPAYALITNSYTINDIINSYELNKEVFNLYVKGNFSIFKAVVKYVYNEDGFNNALGMIKSEYNEITTNYPNDYRKVQHLLNRWNIKFTESLPESIAEIMINDDNMWKDINKNSHLLYHSAADISTVHMVIEKCIDIIKSEFNNIDECYNYIIKNMLYITSNTKNMYLLKTLLPILNINNIEDENSYNNMKFDYIIQNPPYNGSTHLTFLEKGYNLLSKTGNMVIIEPATWLINVRKNTRPNYNIYKNLVQKHVYKIIIENYNKEFNTALYVPFSITYIDKTQEYNNILYSCCGYNNYITNLNDCNTIGNYNIIWSIINKVLSYNDTLKNHIYIHNKTKITNNTYFCKYADIIGRGFCELEAKVNGGKYESNANWTTTKNGDYINGYLSGAYHYKCNNISNNPINKLDAGKKLTNELADNLYGTKEELENWKYFIFNNKLPLFLNIVLVIDQNNTSKDVLCWLTDKQYTDNEINQLFNFTDEEIKLINKTIKKFERNSPWFKRYICGPNSVSDEEIQKFCENL